MARFKYAGDVVRSFVSTMGSTQLIHVPTKNGTWLTLYPRDQVRGFLVDEVLNYEFTDARSIRMLRADPRFQEVVE